MPAQELHTIALGRCIAETEHYTETSMPAGRTSTAPCSWEQLAVRRQVQQVEHTRSAEAQESDSLYIFEL